MGASDLTTGRPVNGSGEVVDDDARAPAGGHVAKKRKKQKALAGVAANGHAGKVAKKSSKAATNGSRASSGSKVAPPEQVEPADGEPLAADPPQVNGNGNGKHGAASNGAIVAGDPPSELPELDDTAELRVAEDFDDAEDLCVAEDFDDAQELRYADELYDAEELRVADELDLIGAELGARTDGDAPSDGGRRARRRAAKLAKKSDGAQPADGEEKVKQSRRQARKALAAYQATPAARRAHLVATSASIAAAVAEARAADPPAPKPLGKYVRRLFALVAILMIPASVSALVVTDAKVTPLSHADATFMSKQLVTADQRVRRQLEHLRPRHTVLAVARTRDATALARSLALEIRNDGGAEATRLQRALRLESTWLDAVGSVLLNPRSSLRTQLEARDAPLVAALAQLASPAGPRKGGSHALARYARARIADTRKSKRRR